MKLQEITGSESLKGNPTAIMKRFDAAFNAAGLKDVDYSRSDKDGDTIYFELEDSSDGSASMEFLKKMKKEFKDAGLNSQIDGLELIVDYRE